MLDPTAFTARERADLVWIRWLVVRHRTAMSEFCVRSPGGIRLCMRWDPRVGRPNMPDALDWDRHGTPTANSR